MHSPTPPPIVMRSMMATCAMAAAFGGEEPLGASQPWQATDLSGRL
jgi:hypothetical protein